jgi:hypothetical protein
VRGEHRTWLAFAHVWYTCIGHNESGKPCRFDAKQQPVFGGHAQTAPLPGASPAAQPGRRAARQSLQPTLPPAASPTAHPALVPVGVADNDVSIGPGSRFETYNDTICLNKAGRGYQPQGYWGADDGADPNDATARSEWQRVDGHGNVIETSVMAAADAAAGTPRSSASRGDVAAAARAGTAFASPVGECPAQMHPALVPVWDDNGGFGDDSSTPEFTWSAVEAARGGGGAWQKPAASFEVHEDTELLPGDSSPARAGSKGARPVQRETSEGDFAVHADTELLPQQHPAIAEDAAGDKFAVHEDTELLPQGTRSKRRSVFDDGPVGASAAFAVHEDTELLPDADAAARPGNSFSMHNDTELLHTQEHPARTQAGDTSLQVYQDTELLTEQHPALRVEASDGAFVIHTDTELLTRAHPATAAQPGCTQSFSVHQDTELLRTQEHPALAQQQSQAFQIHQDTELLTGQPVQDSTLQVHQDTELLPASGTPGLERRGTLKNAEAVKAPKPGAAVDKLATNVRWQLRCLKVCVGCGVPVADDVRNAVPVA